MRTLPIQRTKISKELINTKTCTSMFSIKTIYRMGESVALEMNKNIRRFSIQNELIDESYTESTNFNHHGLGYNNVEKMVDDIGKQLRSTEESASKIVKESVKYSYRLSQQIIDTEKQILKDVTGFAKDMLKDIGNIPNWSHLFGGFVLLILGNMALDVLEQHNSPQSERYACIIFLVSSIFAMISSVCYHLFRQHSKQLFHITIVIDYIGIAFLIFGSFSSAMYYVFYCQPVLLRNYINIMLVLCVITGCIVSHPYFNVNEFRFLRFGVYFGTSAFFCVPYIHILLLSSSKWIDLHYCILAEIVFYLIGGLCFAFQFPERFSRFKGKYDLFFASHQLWHLCVLVALLIHFSGLYQAIYQSRDVNVGGYQCN